jgi:hypothetical protein
MSNSEGSGSAATTEQHGEDRNSVATDVDGGAEGPAAEAAVESPLQRNHLRKIAAPAIITPALSKLSAVDHSTVESVATPHAPKQETESQSSPHGTRHHTLLTSAPKCAGTSKQDTPQPREGANKSPEKAGAAAPPLIQAAGEQWLAAACVPPTRNFPRRIPPGFDPLIPARSRDCHTAVHLDQ